MHQRHNSYHPIEQQTPFYASNGQTGTEICTRIPSLQNSSANVPADSLTQSFEAFYSSSTDECELNTLEINELEAKIDELIQLCTDLERNIAVLHTDKQSWAEEKSRLLEKNHLAKNKIEAMIMRLKALEQD